MYQSKTESSSNGQVTTAISLISSVLNRLGINRIAEGYILTALSHIFGSYRSQGQILMHENNYQQLYDTCFDICSSAVINIYINIQTFSIITLSHIR